MFIKSDILQNKNCKTEHWPIKGKNYRCMWHHGLISKACWVKEGRHKESVLCGYIPSSRTGKANVYE